MGSTVGKKVAMAITGLILFGYVILHMAGNLKAFQGPEKLNSYAEFLREMGAPILGHSEMLWIVRVILLIAVVVHIVTAVQLTRVARAARPVRYARAVHLEDTYASRTMRWGGVIITAFVTYHVMHLTFGRMHADFVAGDVYHNLVVAFQVPLVVAAYTFAVGTLGFHLFHGIWSALQTLGLNRSRTNGVRTISGAVAVAIVLGFLAPPYAILLGVIR